MKKLAVVGAGPKGVALAAKCAALSELGHMAPELTIFEQSHIGSAWSGRGSFTNGEALICTNIDRDLGFPYDDPVSDQINSHMLGEYSWRTFLLSTSSQMNLNEWLTKGFPRPTHREFSRYLQWALEKSQAARRVAITLQEAEVSSLRFNGTSWRVSAKSESGTTEHTDLFDGVVITGVKRRPDPLVPEIDDENVPAFDGANFWEEASLDCLSATITNVLSFEDTVKVVVVGDGGTAAAVCHYLSLHHPSRASLTIHVIGSNPFFDSRPDNFFSDRFYADDQLWRDRTATFRREFLGRTMRGRVWQPIIEDLQYCELEYECARVLGAQTEVLHGDRFQFEGEMCDDGTNTTTGGFEADVIIDARGFHDLWFLDLLPDDISKVLSPAGEKPSSVKSSLEEMLDTSFQINTDGIPKGLHLPILGSFVHAAANNLMALGSVTDGLLAPYRR